MTDFHLIASWVARASEFFLTALTNIIFSVKEGSGPFGIDTSIEGMNSQEFSVAIFYFLIASIGVFVVFIFLYMFMGKTPLKRGEKILFGWIIFGVIMAIIFGAAQMLHGYLF